jgi:hypothetical protein
MPVGRHLPIDVRRGGANRRGAQEGAHEPPGGWATGHGAGQGRGATTNLRALYENHLSVKALTRYG